MKGKGIQKISFWREYLFLTEISKVTNFIIGGFLAGHHWSPLIQCSLYYRR